jgi:hypothetical protein
VTRALALLVFDYGLDPETVERMPVSRLQKYIKLAVDLNSEREKQRAFR